MKYIKKEIIQGKIFIESHFYNLLEIRKVWKNFRKKTNMADNYYYLYVEITYFKYGKLMHSKNIFISKDMKGIEIKSII